MFTFKLLAVIFYFVAFICISRCSSCNEVKTFDELSVGMGNDMSNLGVLDSKTFNESVDDCKCGKNSKSCELNEGLKTCICEEGYVPGINENCTEMCNDTHKCENGGTCHNGICLCPPRTRGPFCEEIYVLCYYSSLYQRKALYRGKECCCKTKTNYSAECRYDIKKHDAYCKCPKQGEVFDGDSNKCNECNCGKSNTWTNCEFISGVKTCSCIRHYEYNLKTETCEPCYCGEFSKKSAFTWNGDVICSCLSGYQQWNNTCIKCNCGSNGNCELREGQPICHCNTNTQEQNGTCLECGCGKHGHCVFGDDGKKLKCECDEGYSDQDGHCVYCYCGDNSACKLNSTDEKMCMCSPGYEAVNGFCTDIDECVDLKACPVTEKCVNLPGSYICGCADGYIHTGSGCSDINECLEKDICGGNNRECVNTPGSFECMCKSGYLSQGGPKKSLICERNSASMVGYGLLSALFVGITIGLLVILYRKYRK